MNEPMLYTYYSPFSWNLNWILSMFIDLKFYRNSRSLCLDCYFIIQSCFEVFFQRFLLGLKCLERLHMSLEGVMGDLEVKNEQKRDLTRSP